MVYLKGNWQPYWIYKEGGRVYYRLRLTEEIYSFVNYCARKVACRVSDIWMWLVRLRPLGLCQRFRQSLNTILPVNSKIPGADKTPRDVKGASHYLSPLESAISPCNWSDSSHKNEERTDMLISKLYSGIKFLRLHQ